MIYYCQAYFALTKLRNCPQAVTADLSEPQYQLAHSNIQVECANYEYQLLSDLSRVM